MKIKKLFGFFILLALTSCLGDEYLNTPISDTIVANPGVAVPIGFVELDVHKIASKNTNRIEFTTDENGEQIVSVFQKEDSLVFFGLNELYTIPPASSTIPIPFSALQLGALLVKDSLNLSFTNGVIIEATSKLKYSISANNFPYPVQLTLVLKDVYSPKQNPITIQRTLTTGSSISIDSILDAHTTLKNNKFAFSISLSKTALGNSSSAIGSLTIAATLSELTYIKGSLDETSLSIDEQSVDMNMGIFQLGAQGSIIYDNPSFEINYTNSTPYDIFVSPSIKGYNSETNNSITLITNPFLIEKRASLTEATIDTFAYNKYNSNIKSFIANSSDTLNFSGDALINPSTINSSISEITKDQGLYLGYNLKMPLQISVTNLSVSDTIDFDNSEFLNMIDKAILSTISTNGFPFEAQSVLEFCDKDFVVLDTLKLQLFKAAAVDADGYVIDEQISPSKQDNELTDEKLENFKNSKHIIIVTKLFTTGYTTNKIVTIQEKNYLNINLGLKTLLDASKK